MTILVVYCLLILVASILGGVMPLMMRFTHSTMQLAVSFVAGVMLGVGFLHMLPHAAQMFDEDKYLMLWVLGGFLLMFFIQRYLVVHQHVAPHGETASEHRCGETDEVHHQSHEDIAAQTPGVMPAKRMSGAGAAVGLSIHSMLNGVALAAAVQAQAKAGWLAGFATFVAIFVHKPFDSMTITTLLAAGGWSKKACYVINALFSLVLPVGVLIFHLGLGQAAEQQRLLLGCALGISAGVFLCIAASDLLPEMQFHTHDRGPLSFWLIAGVALAYLVEFAGG